MSGTIDVVSHLVRACTEDSFPTEEGCLRTFMFDRVRSVEEAECLLGVYIGAVKLLPAFVSGDLANAVDNGEIAQYVLGLYDAYGQDSFYSAWLRRNMQRFLAVSSRV